MIYSGDRILALAGNQLTTTLIAGGSVVALIILFLCFQAMSRPIPGYHAPENTVSTDSTPTADTTEAEASLEKKRTGTRGFVLPLPSEGVPQASITEFPQVSTPAPPQAKMGVSEPSQPPHPPLRPTEQTADISRVTTGGVDATALREGGIPIAGRPMAHRNVLVFRSGARTGEKIQLDSYADGQCAIGRSDVPENQVIIRDDLKVSRVQHAVITCGTAGQFSIRDNNSANKVFVNEQCIEGSPVLLNNGDKILIGLTEFEYLKEPVS